MNEPGPVARILLFLAAFALAGCADELADPQTVADAPRPDPDAGEVAQPGVNIPETDDVAPPESIQYGPLEVGDDAPEFVATGLDGEPMSLSDYRGKQHVVLAFSRAHW